MTEFERIGREKSSIRELERRWKGLTFANDFVFGAVLRTDLDLCRRFLEVILDEPIERVELLETQRVIDPAYGAKSIRLDAYVADGSGIVYDIEMQRTNAYYLPKRSRYYQSLIDAEQLDKGAGYNDLPDTFVIFICNFDPFGEGLRRYTFRQTCQESASVDAWDGTTRLFLNSAGTRGEVSDELAKLLLYINGGYRCRAGACPSTTCLPERKTGSRRWRMTTSTTWCTRFPTCRWHTLRYGQITASTPAQTRLQRSWPTRPGSWARAGSSSRGRVPALHKRASFVMVWGNPRQARCPLHRRSAGTAWGRTRAKGDCQY